MFGTGMGIGFVLGITSSTISLIVPGRTTSVMTTVATMAPATISETGIEIIGSANAHSPRISSNIVGVL